MRAVVLRAMLLTGCVAPAHRSAALDSSPRPSTETVNQTAPELTPPAPGPPTGDGAAGANGASGIMPVRLPPGSYIDTTSATAQAIAIALVSAEPANGPQPSAQSPVIH
jgi:hypothetical protein